MEPMTGIRKRAFGCCCNRCRAPGRPRGAWSLVGCCHARDVRDACLRVHVIPIELDFYRDREISREPSAESYGRAEWMLSRVVSTFKRLNSGDGRGRAKRALHAQWAAIGRLLLLREASRRDTWHGIVLLYQQYHQSVKRRRGDWCPHRIRVSSQDGRIL